MNAKSKCGNKMYITTNHKNTNYFETLCLIKRKFNISKNQNNLNK